MKIGNIGGGSVGRLLALFLILACWPAGSQAQDSHYWTNQYGTRAQLLNGVVVGSILDLSSTFYNPGSSALSSDRTLVLTTSAADLIAIEVEGGAAAGKDLRSLRLASAPSIFAVALSSASRRHKWAISYLTRYDVDFEVDARRVGAVENPGQPDDGNVFAELNFAQRLSEPWAGVSWSYKANPHIGLGATMYTGIRSHRARFQTTAEGTDSDSTGAVILATNEYRYWNVRLLGKTGVFLDYDPLKAGLSVTTPSLNLFGDGSTTINAFSLGLDTDGNGTPDANMAADYQDELSSTFKSPFSIALGASYVIGSTSLFATVESFAGVSRYDVLSPKPFVSQSSGDTLTYRFTQAAKAVTNWGFGVEHHLAGKTTLYGGFITDRSSFDYDRENFLTTISSWDIYHLSLGGTFAFSTLEFTAGGDYSWGDNVIDQLGSIPDPGDPIEGKGSPRSVSYRRFRLIFGITAGI